MNKISFDTAKKLKEMKWPQLGDGDALVLDWPIPESDETVTVIPWSLYVHNPMPNHEVVYGPTLQELIDGCGSLFKNLEREDEGVEDGGVQWIAFKTDTIGEGGTGDNPSEAVAKLWLSLPSSHLI